MADSASKARDHIEQAIRSSESVGEGNYVTVKVEKSGFLFFGSSKVILTGRTKSEKDKAAIEELAQQNAGGAEVESRLRVSKVG